MPQKLYGVDINTKKKKTNYKGKEHSHLEIAELIELRGWAKREKNVMSKMKAIFLQFCAKKYVRQTATPTLQCQIQKLIQYQPSLKYFPKT